MNRYRVYGVDDEGKSVIDYVDALTEDEAWTTMLELRRSAIIWTAIEPIGEEE